MQTLFAVSRSNDIFRLARDERVYIADKLVGERLNRFATRPGNMRRQNEIRHFEESHEDVVFGRRFDGRDIESRARQSTLTESLGEGVLIHEPAARRVDQKRPSLHQGELSGAYQVSGAGDQRRVQCDDVALAQHLFEWGVERSHSRRPLIVGKEDAHAERLAEIGDGFPQNSVADDSERRAGQIPYGVVEEAELRRLLPASSQDGLAISQYAPP